MARPRSRRLEPARLARVRAAAQLLHRPDAVRDPAEVARLTAMGARELWRGAQGPSSWVTMADPEGNEFCVA